jgi:hypothetical protein
MRDSHAGDYEDYCFLGCDAVQSGKSNYVAEETALPTCIREDGVSNLGFENNYQSLRYMSGSCLLPPFSGARMWKRYQLAS